MSNIGPTAETCPAFRLDLRADVKV